MVLHNQYVTQPAPQQEARFQSSSVAQDAPIVGLPFDLSSKKKMIL